MIVRLIAIAAGTWLIAAPAALDYGGVASDNDRTVGPIVACLALVAMWDLGRPLRWVTLPLGIWLLAAPLALGYDDAPATVSSLTTGLAITLSAPAAGVTRHAYAGGWRSLARRGR